MEMPPALGPLATPVLGFPSLRLVHSRCQGQGPSGQASASGQSGNVHYPPQIVFIALLGLGRGGRSGSFVSEVRFMSLHATVVFLFSMNECIQ